MDEKLIEMLKFIRLRGLIANWERYLDVAREGDFSHVRLLKYIIEEEFKLRKDNSRRMRLQRAQIPEKYVMETFPFHMQPKLDKKKVSAIYDSFDYISKIKTSYGLAQQVPERQALPRPFSSRRLIMAIMGDSLCFPELIETLYKSGAIIPKKR